MRSITHRLSAPAIERHPRWPTAVAGRVVAAALIVGIAGGSARSAFASEDAPPGPEGAAAADARAEFARTEAEVRAAKSWANHGVLIPALAGATFSIITEPGGKTDVPVWQSATLASLFGFAGFWGVSMGYYRAGRPGYATFSGLGRMALLAGGIGLDRWAVRGCNQEEQVCDGFPVGALLSLVAVIGWSASDYQRLDEAVRTKARTSTWTALPMVTASPEGGLRAGLVGRF